MKCMGLNERTSLFNTARIDHLFEELHDTDQRFYTASWGHDGFIKPYSNYSKSEAG